MAKSKKKGKTISVDMTGVETSGRVKEGPNVLTVDSIEEKEGQNGTYLAWQFSASTGGKVWENTSLTPQSLWKLRGLLEALGLEVEDGTLDLDLEEYVGLELGAEIEHELYQGKKKGVIVEMFAAEDVQDGGGSSGGDDDGDDGDGDDDSEEFDLSELDDDDLRKLAVEMDLAKKGKAKKLNTKKLLALFEDEEEDDIVKAATELDLIGDDEEEGEKKPSKKSSKKKKKGGDAEIVKGSTVSFEDDDEEYQGEVIKINKKKGVYTIETDEAEWELELDDLTLVDD